MEDAKAPHAILYRKDLKKLFVVEGDASAVRVYDSDTYKPLGEIKVSIDADSIAYDSTTHYLYVVNGGREAHTPYCLISVIDTNTSKKLRDIKIDSNHVEAIVLETATSTLFNSSTPITTPCWGGSKEAFAQKPAFSFRNSIATIWPCHITKARTPKCGCTIYSRRRSSTPVMLRRKFAKASLGAIASSPFFHSAKGAPLPARDDFPQVHGLTNYVGKFVVETRYEDVPREVIELGKKSILDGLGLALAGSRAQTGAICRRYLEHLGGCGGKATVVGSGLKTSPRFAAWTNGISIHADDFDDTQLSAAKDRVYGLLVHPTVPVLPAILALSAQRNISGKEFMLAYHLGVEVECKIAEAISPRHYQDGFHSTGTCGALGSAAACAKLLRFDQSKVQNALGLAASQSGGLRENFGTMTKPFQAGHAAESGVVSANLVALGWTAAEQILEADRGFFHAFGGSYDPSALMNRLGKPWTFASPGISLKPYPSGSLTHPAMTELMRLIEANNIQADQVEKVDCGANHNVTTTLLHRSSNTGLEAKFIMTFCLAILLLERKAGLGEFSDKVVQRADVQEMIWKINFYVDPQAESAGFDKMMSILKIHLRDGRVITGRADFAKGSPANPMSFDEAATKFRGCAEYANWPKVKTEKIIAFVKTLDSASDISALSRLLSAEKG